MLEPSGSPQETERERKRRALLLALASSALLSLFFLLLVWSPVPKPPEATGYLLLELGSGAPQAGKEQPPVAAKPKLEEPPAPPPAEKPPAKPAEPAVMKKPEPQPKPQPKPEPQAKPKPKPQTATPAKAPPEATKPPEAVEPAKPMAKPEATKPVAPAAQEPPAPLPEAKPAPQAEAAPEIKPATPEPGTPATAPQEPAPESAPAPPVAGEKPQPLAPGKEPLPEPAAPPAPSPTPAAAKPASAAPPAAESTPPAPQQTAPELPASLPEPTAPAPSAPAATAGQPAASAPVETPSAPPEPAFSPQTSVSLATPAPAPAPPAPAAPALAPAPPAPAPPLAGGEPSPAPPAPAASPQQGKEQGGAIGPGEKPYRLKRLRPILAAIDNARAAFPQWGLERAVQIHEVPMEGGVTRLLVRFEGGEKGKIGPVRSARPYILKLAEAMGAVLLHVGGSPEALSMIEKQGLTTFDGLYDPLFKRDRSRRPPHNTYVVGKEVRRQMSRLHLENVRILRGKAYRPPADAPPGERVEVRYAPDYASSFRYDGKGYVWFRNGNRTDVQVTAVVVLRVGAEVVDKVGRLHLDLSKGHGALYLEGKRVPVIWRFEGSLLLSDEHGNPIDLTPYKTWFFWVPPWGKVL